MAKHDGGSDRRDRQLPTAVYEAELLRLQVELVKVQEWVRAEKQRIVIVFEGRDAAGKGGTIKRVAEYLNPRVARIAALPAPTQREEGQWYFQRYIEHLPSAGEMVFFDRSWYNRAGVERVMGFCTPDEYRRFLHQCPIFERLLVEDGILLRKYWFSVSDQEQQRRFKSRLKDPLRQWKLSPIDLAVDRPVGGLLAVQGRDDGAHRHPRGALVRRGERRQDAGPAQHDRALPLDDPLRRRTAPDHRAAAAAEAQGLRAPAPRPGDHRARPLRHARD